MVTRREFLDALGVGVAALAVNTTAKSYAQIIGSNDRLNFAVIGLNGRAYAHLRAREYRQALADANEAIRLDPKYKNALQVRAAAQRAVSKSQ